MNDLYHQLMVTPLKIFLVVVLVLVLVLDNKLPSTTTRTRTSELGLDGAGPSSIFIHRSESKKVMEHFRGAASFRNCADHTVCGEYGLMKPAKKARLAVTTVANAFTVATNALCDEGTTPSEAYPR